MVYFCSRPSISSSNSYTQRVPWSLLMWIQHGCESHSSECVYPGLCTGRLVMSFKRALLNSSRNGFRVTFLKSPCSAMFRVFALHDFAHVLFRIQLSIALHSVLRVFCTVLLVFACVLFHSSGIETAVCRAFALSMYCAETRSSSDLSGCKA